MSTTVLRGEPARLAWSALLDSPAPEEIPAVFADQVETRDLVAGEWLFHVGDPGDMVYVLVDGHLNVTIPSAAGEEAVVDVVEPGQPVGQMQLMATGLRTTTVRATVASRILQVPRSAIYEMTDGDDALGEQFSDAMRRRSRRSQLRRVIHEVFGDHRPEAIHDIESAVRWVELQKGDVLFRHGDPGSSIFVVISGRLRAMSESPGDDELPRVLGEARRAETVGEMALFTDESRSATMYAVRDTLLVELTREDFERVTTRHPTLLRHVTRTIIERLKAAQSGRVTRHVGKVVAIVPFGLDPGAFRSFSRDLHRAISEHDTAVRLGPEEVAQRLGHGRIPDGRGLGRVSALIEEEESRHSFVLLEADAEATTWSARCVRHADEVVLVARADGPLPRSELEEQIRASPGPESPKQILVLLHDRHDHAPRDTRRWLEGRSYVRHHHVALDRSDGTSRVARFLTGRALGVALSGGGARGFAHIGVLRALQEYGMPIDMICGTSMGAVVAALHSLGRPWESMEQATDGLFGNWMSDLTLPVVSVLGGHRSAERLRLWIPDVRIEDLWLPYFCASTNLTRAELVIHREGQLRFGIRASVGVPGLLPPVVSNGDLLVDGGLLRNLPADILSEHLDGGPVIAVDVSADIDLGGNPSYGDSISGWRALWSKLTPFSNAVYTPSIASILQRAAEVPSAAAERELLRTLHGVYLRLPVETFGLLDFKAAPRLIETGYRFAKEHLTHPLPFPDPKRRVAGQTG